MIPNHLMLSPSTGNLLDAQEVSMLSVGDREGMTSKLFWVYWKGECQ